MVSDGDTTRPGPGIPPGAEELLAAAIALSSERDLDHVLERIVAEARRVLQARYAAIAIYEAGKLWRFVQQGLAERDAARIASCPVSAGLLEVVQAAEGPLRVDDIAADPRSCGFPAGHPPMRSLLGAPVATGRRRFGNLYLCDPVDGSPFAEQDEATVAVFARLAAAAVETAFVIRAERDQIAAQAEAAASREREAAQRELLGLVIAAQEAERARVSRDLHDEIGQALTSVLLGLRLAEGTDAEDDEAPVGRLAEVRELVTDALERVRSLAFDLRPTVLDDVGLAPALERLVRDVGARSGVKVGLDIGGVDSGARFPTEIETVIYRVVQEALTNVVRHAAAEEASVQVVADRGRLRAVIEDDGRGFDPEEHRGSLGLAGMRERAVLAGGSLRVESAPGTGTTVVVEVPVG